MAIAVHITIIRYKFVTVLLLKRLRNGSYISETAVRRFQRQTAIWIQKRLKYPCGKDF
jgi:hypothetical protein